MTAAPQEALSARTGRHLLTVVFSRYGLLVAWIVTIVVFGILQFDLFLQPRNFQTIFSERSVLLMLTLGMLPALAAG